LQLEYPLYHFNPHYQPWISGDTTLPSRDGHVDRAVAKALYSRAYYDGDRPLAAALRRFRKSVEATSLDSVVCVVYGLGGGTGSGVAVDLARHLSTVEFGHSVVVVGMGIAPCDGDSPEHRSSALFPVITELDCMLDETKNRGVVAALGDLYPAVLSSSRSSPFGMRPMTSPQLTSASIVNYRRCCFATMARSYGKPCAF
jgi:hypothetical protein